MELQSQRVYWLNCMHIYPGVVVCMCHFSPINYAIDVRLKGSFTCHWMWLPFILPLILFLLLLLLQCVLYTSFYCALCPSAMRSTALDLGAIVHMIDSREKTSKSRISGTTATTNGKSERIFLHFLFFLFLLPLLTGCVCAYVCVCIYIYVYVCLEIDRRLWSLGTSQPCRTQCGR